MVFDNIAIEYSQIDRGQAAHLTGSLASACKIRHPVSQITEADLQITYTVREISEAVLRFCYKLQAALQITGERLVCYSAVILADLVANTPLRA